CLVVVELPVDHHHGGVVAGRVALKALDCDLAVRRLDVSVMAVVVCIAAHMLGKLRPDLVAAHDGTGRVGADPDLVFGGRLVLVHRVEGRYAAHFGFRDAKHLGAERHAVVRDIALFRLHQVQQRQQCGPCLRIPSGDLDGVRLQPGQRFLTERHYLSTPPITGSIDAIAGITSARLPPSHSTETACKWWNEGSRMCARYGRVVPSLTTWQASSPLGDSMGTYAWPAGTRKPSVTSLKWWMSASMDWPMMCAMCSGDGPRPSGPSDSRAGQPILATWMGHGSFVMLARSCRRSMTCLMSFSDSSTSAIRTTYLP